ncbi:UNVERIFIED_CONTAM: protein PHLOEM PROTEIN 2-LIKE A10 [Sesamum angustifolium]|uniref:Protein PHLOEM PROTEIN 2-LIKE A10 n=1 Tax=Sesamum angustifolium TaxID=2727405 RepID=A0AAW2IQP1_9LAMI
MDTRLVSFTKKKKKWIVLLGLIGFSSYGVYKISHIPSVERKRKRILRLLGCLISMAEMVSESVSLITLISKDLKEFLSSNQVEIPNSLKQLQKIARSEEFSESVIRVCQATIIGIVSGCKIHTSKSEIQEVDGSCFLEKMIDKLMSTAGTEFSSIVVGSFARNLVLGFQTHKKSSSPTWVSVVSDDKCRALAADCIRTFVTAAATVCVDKTVDVNFYDELFSGMTNPKHQNKVTGLLVSLCNGAVETLVRTSHQVLTASKQSQKLGSVEYGKNGRIDLKNTGWVDSVSSTLAVPRNRKFVLDVTGRVTFETVRSVIEFFLWKMSEGLNRSVDVAVERGFEVVRYVGAKSSVILTQHSSFVACIK